MSYISLGSLSGLWANALLEDTEMVVECLIFPLVHCQDFGRTPSYLERMKAEAQEEARRWQQEQEAELRRKEAMKLSDEERLDILQVDNL